MIKKLFVILLSILSAGLYAAEPKVTALVTPNAVFIGDVVQYSIRIELGLNDKLLAVPSKVDFSKNPNLSPVLSDPDQPIYRVNKEETAQSRFIKLNYPFRVFAVGDQLIPSQQITVSLENTGADAFIDIPEIPITVLSVRNPGESAIVLSNVFYTEALNRSSILMFALCVLLVVAITTYLVMVYRRYLVEKEKGRFQDIVDHRTPLQKAEDALNALVQEDYYSQGLPKEHYVHLTEIVKRYLEELFNTHVLDLTTSETLLALEPHISSEDLKRLKHILDFSDIIKFAKQLPLKEQHKEYIDKSRDFIVKVNALVQEKRRDTES